MLTPRHGIMFQVWLSGRSGTDNREAEKGISLGAHKFIQLYSGPFTKC
jgi:hypothetical protein